MSILYYTLSVLFLTAWILCVVFHVQTTGYFLLLLPATFFFFVGLFRGAKHEFPGEA